MIRPVPALVLVLAMAAGGLLPLATPPARAARRLELSGSLGRTFAILGDIHQGGEAVEIDALVPAARAWSLGLAVYGADMGQATERLLDPNNGTDLGAVGGPTRYVIGLGPALELHPWATGTRAPGALRGLSLAGTAGPYRITVEAHGKAPMREDAIGWALAARWQLPVGGHGALGPWARYTRVFDDRLGRYASAGMEWTWR